MNCFKLLGFIVMAHAVFAQQSAQFPVTIPVSGPLTLQNALISPVDRAAFAAKQNALGLANKLPYAFIGGAPSKVSAFQNDALYLTAITLVPLLPLPIPGPLGPIGLTGAVGPEGQSGPAGPIGPQGLQGPPGPLNFTGTWDAATVYVVGNMAAYNRSSYISLTDANTGNQPDVDVAANTGNWALVAQAGDPGPTGPTGPTGPVGASGLQGNPGSTGPQGIKGATGATGPQGPPGSGSSHQISVTDVAYGASPTLADNSKAFQNAINAAKMLNNGAGTYHGAALFIPSGYYKFANHIVLPRNGILPDSSSDGAVALICEDRNSTVLDFSADTTDMEAITWDGSSTRTSSQVIKNCTIVHPKTPGNYAIHYAYTAANRAGCSSGAANGTNCYNERQEDLDIEDIYFISNSNTAKASVYLEGDCINCTLRNFTQRVTTPNGIYNTILILADTCYSIGAEATEACGYNLSHIEKMSAGTTGGGGASVFQGRMGDTHFSTSFCDGVFGNSQNPYCYLFVNSAGNFIQGAFDEGNGGVQMRFDNCHLNQIENWGLGTPIAADVPSDGLQLNNSSQNTFSHLAANPWSVQNWGLLAPGFFRVRLTNSHNNRFFDLQLTGSFVSEVSRSDDQTSNFFQWCDATGDTATANCRQGPMGKVGNSPY